MRRTAFLLLVFLVGVVATHAQQDMQLGRLLENKTTMGDIINVVKTYYTDPQTITRLGQQEVDRKLKKWKRWEWFMSSRLGRNGELVNITEKMIQATGLQSNRSLSNNREQAVSGSWTLVGPYDTPSGIGRVDRLAFHPTNANIVYAGSTAGGLWRTTDAGTSWTNLTPDILSPGIGGIAIDPVNPNIIYILTGDGDSDGGGLVKGFGYMRTSIGVLKSTNGGATWTRTGVFPGASNSMLGYRLVMHPTNNNILYACTDEGLFWTVNGGDTWGLLQAGRFFNLAFRPGSGNICYATSGVGWARFWKSTTSGVVMDTVNAINVQINNPSERVELAVAPSNPSVVYLLCGGVASVTGQFKGVFRSADSGDSFTLQSNTPNIVGRASNGLDTAEQSTYDLTIAVSNTNSATVAVGAIQVWRSLNSGNTWDYRGAGIHDDVHELKFNPVDNKLWAATDGGVYSSTDNGATWTSHFEGMSVTQFYRMAVSPADYLDMIAGAQDNGTKQRTGNTSFFEDISGADGFTVGYDQADESIYYAILNTNVVRFTGNGAGFSSITPSNTNHPFAMSLAVHTGLGDALFIGSDTIWRTTNAGGNWSATNVDAGWFLRTCPSNSNRVYAAGGTAYNAGSGILRRSDDGGASWVADILSNNPGFPDDYPKITSINVNPTNSLQVWVTFGGFEDNVKVAYSSDGGVNWVNRSGTLPNLPVNCIALDNNNNAYIGTDNGVYYRGTGMSDWVPFYNNLPYVPVSDIILSEPENRLRVSTFGRGIWSSELYSACVANVNVVGTLEGQEFYEASNNVTSTASLQTSDGTKVQMRGGIEVNLLPGFTARETTQFRALIGPCGSGGVAGFRTISEGTVFKPQELLKPSAKTKVLLHIDAQANDLKTIITVREEGEIQLQVTDAEGNRVKQFDKTFYSKGRLDKQFAINRSSLKPGLYYVHVIHNGVWERMQEWEVK